MKCYERGLKALEKSVGKDSIRYKDWMKFYKGKKKIMSTWDI